MVANCTNTQPKGTKGYLNIITHKPLNTIIYNMENKNIDGLQLTDAQKDALKNWQLHPDQMCMRLYDGYWLTGGVGIKIPKNTFRALKRKGLINDNDRLTAEAKTLKL